MDDKVNNPKNSPLADMANLNTGFNKPNPLSSRFKLNTGPEETSASAPATNGSQIIMDIPVDVQVVLGSTTMQVAALMNLSRGSIINLETSLDEPLNIVVNGRVIAKGEIVPLANDPTKFGISLLEILNNK
ncbi:flagellar motor switch protein FliN [Bartonella sp. TP]|uniref:flagellar motor switch protein FliN n=1 Tax=Bartonella sp. TP TaxID=3057550 RepID=UPI0025AEEA0C|nr:flagellar motor switch protein FliN [Bartonella sp. TP]MDN5249065.1 flagellar motor switch protein FliN [Alphaproteobacteria bacterium]WJW80282.1 flagellar motor switch protein FliN [Bartonella sp. TP]